MAKGLLVAAFDFSTAHADEFHDWYDLEHIPERKAVLGFGACERWIGEEEPTFSVATYDLCASRKSISEAAPFWYISCARSRDSRACWRSLLSIRC